MAEKLSNGNDFRNLVFSASEISYCEGKANKFKHMLPALQPKKPSLKRLAPGGWMVQLSTRQK